jgi:hypothetical protein
MIDDTKCTYCGGIALEWDHVIPVALLRPSSIERYKSDDWIVPSCRECNSMLSDRMLHTVPLRARYLLKAYKKRYKKVLRNHSWSQEDIDELEGSFKQLIIDTMDVQKELDCRLLHLINISRKDMDYMKK